MVKPHRRASDYSRLSRLESLEDRSLLSVTPVNTADGIDYVATGLDNLLLHTAPAVLPGFEAVNDKVEYRLQEIAAGIESSISAGEITISPGAGGAALLNMTDAPDARVNGAGEILVYADVQLINQSLLNQFADLGVQVSSSSSELGIIESWVPYDKVEDLAALADIHSLRLPVGGISNAGLVLPLSDEILNADDVRTDLGFDGTGIRVGVISDGVDNRALVQGGANPDLPAITVNPTLTGFGDEGTAISRLFTI